MAQLISYLRVTFEAFSVKGLRNLLVSSLLTSAGFQLLIFTRGVLTYELTGSSFITGITISVFSIPLILFALFGGVFAEMYDKKKIIWGAQFLAAFLSVALAILIITNLIEWYYILVSSFLQGLLIAFQFPARQTSISDLAGTNKKLISNAFILNAGLISINSAIIPAVGGVIYEFYGPEVVYFISAALYTAGGIMNMFLPKLSKSNLEHNFKTAFREVKLGLIYLVRHSLLWHLILFSIITGLLAFTFRVLTPVWGVELFGATPTQIGFLFQVFGIGAIVTTLIVAGVSRKDWLLKLIILSGLISTIGFVLLLSFKFYSIALLTMFVLGVGEIMRQSISQSLIIQNTSAKFRSRISSIVLLGFSALPLGALPAGLIFETIGIDLSILILAILMPVIVVIFTLFSHHFRKALIANFVKS